MKRKTKKKLITWAVVLIIVAVLGYAAYRQALYFVGDTAMNKIVSEQINTMLSEGEVTISELEEIIAEPEDEPEEEETPPEKEEKPAEKKPSPSEPTQKNDVVKQVADKVTGNITREDKEAMAKLISSRLTAADISTLMGYAKGGLTAIEISDAARLAKARFTSEELAQVKIFWHRYKSSVKRAKE